ncbi:MAG: NADPH-dependent F420 reductase [Nitrososphaerales archaeon]|jgi:NADPH-dependent F420 reductase
MTMMTATNEEKSKKRGRIALVGGTGDLGLGLAVRLAPAYDVTVGSRDAARAAAAAAEASRISGARVDGAENLDAARASDIAILAIPSLPSDDVLTSLRPAVAGKLVVSPIVPMEVRDGLFSAPPASASAAERVASVLATRVAAAFHTVPAARLLEVGRELDYDVLVTAETRVVYAEAAAVVSSIPGLRPLYAGPLRNSRMVEELTPNLLNVGKLNGIKHPSIRVV